MIRTLLMLAVLVAPAIADPNAQEQAKAHFKQARVHQRNGQFALAVAEYQAAYALDPRPEMLFNIAQAFRLAGDKRAAVDYYKRYLDAQPDGAGAGEARQHMTALTKEIEAAAPVETDDAPRSDVEPVPPPAPEPAAQPLPPPPAVTAMPPQERPSHDSRRWTIAGITTAGVGAIALGLGVKFGLDARAAADDISQHTGAWTATEQARFDDGQRANRAMIVAYASGGVLVATGAVLYIVGRRARVAPIVGASSAGAVLWGRF